MAKKLQAKPGVKFRGHDLDIWHIVQKVEDGDSVLWVIKSWVPWKKGWLYQIVGDKGMQWLLENQDYLNEQA